MDNLDPKLQEAYKRVMGTQISPDANVSNIPAPVSSETSKPIINEEGMPLIKKILIVFLGIVIVGGYTLFWVFIFHVKVPYLPF